MQQLVPGKLIRLPPGRPHRLEAKQDSRLRPAPRERWHSTVFYAFDNLAPGKSFLLVNDRDPQPLRAQMEDLRPGELTWDYEVQGPYEFRIKVSRVASSEVARLSDQGTVEEAASFRSGGSLTYRIQSRGTEPVHADFSGGAITVLIPTETVRAWAAGDEAGLYAQDGALRIAVEKDFRCLTRAEEEPDAYPHTAG